MANAFYWIDSASNSRTLYIAGTSTTQFVLEGSEYGGGVQGEPHIEATPNRLSNNYRSWLYKPREYGFDVLIKAANAAALETAISTWDGWHDPELGQGYVKRITVGGTTRCLDAIPLPVEWEFEGPTVAKGKQGYIAANPWWRSESASTANGTFNGSVSVNISCANGGHIPAWFTAVITGVVNAPKLITSTGDYIQVNKVTANADDTIAIDTRPWGTYRRYAYYREHGSGTITPVQLTSGSRWIALPTGTNNLAIVGATGETSTASLALSWYLYYRSLY